VTQSEGEVCLSESQESSRKGKNSNKERKWRRNIKVQFWRERNSDDHTEAHLPDHDKSTVESEGDNGAKDEPTRLQTHNLKRE
jgi:hypothetical protein